MATNYETHEYDVLVIGAGGAGLRAAIEASAAGVKVGLICKSLLGKAHFGLGLGTIVLILNPIFLGLYTFGCHSLRHLVGGFLDAKSKAPTCAKAYNCVSCLNTRHMLWAWVSLFWVGFTDVYVRLCATGKIHDIVFFQF